MSRNDRQDLWRAVSIAANTGITLFLCIVFGVWLGTVIDDWFYWKIPWGTIVGGLLGAFIGFWAVIKQIVNK